MSSNSSTSVATSVSSTMPAPDIIDANIREKLEPYFTNKITELTNKEICNLFLYAKLSKHFEKPRNFYDHIMGVMNDFIKGCHLIANDLNERAGGSPLNVLVPGDSGFKIYLYLKNMKLCPNCNFIKFPISRAGFELPDVKKLLEDNVPSTIDNLVILDYIDKGSTIKEIIKLYMARALKGSLEIKQLSLVPEMLSELILTTIISKYISFSINTTDIKTISKSLTKLKDIKDLYNINIYDKIIKSEEIKNPSIIEVDEFEAKIKTMIDTESNEVYKISKKESSIPNDGFRYNRSRLFKFKYYIQLINYFSDDIVANYIYNSEKLLTRCQAGFTESKKEEFNYFGCNFFVYMACIVKNNMETIEKLPKCSICGIPCTNSCSKCKKVFYCSIEDQKLDWQIHKKICIPATAESTAEVESTAARRGGIYYDKYMKYKKKYLSLKLSIV